ncbi:MAG: hypothetical protein WBX25_03350, partial [Rhodomicrobium sp.]
MHILGGARISSVSPSRVEIELSRGYRIKLFFLAPHLARLLIIPRQGLGCLRTWSLSSELAGDDPIDGRDRLDVTGFPESEILEVTETDVSISIESALIKAEIRRSPL